MKKVGLPSSGLPTFIFLEKANDKVYIFISYNLLINYIIDTAKIYKISENGEPFHQKGVSFHQKRCFIEK